MSAPYLSDLSALVLPTSTAAPQLPTGAALAAATAQARIVVVDDEPLSCQGLADFLRQSGHTHVVSLALRDANTQALRDECADLVLLSLTPATRVSTRHGAGPVASESAFKLLQGMQADRQLRHVPVMALLAQDHLPSRLRALEWGATDVLVVPVHGKELRLRLRNTLAAKAFRDQLAHTDPLTGLPNRESLLMRTDWALKQALRHGTVGAVLHIGLDRFQHVNNALGPAVGDELLHAIGQRMVAGTRESDLLTHQRSGADKKALPHESGADADTGAVLARGSGDEFSVLLPRIERVEDAGLVAQRMISSLAEPFVVAGHELFVSCRIGICAFPADSADRDTVLQHASVAMRSARQMQAQTSNNGSGSGSGNGSGNGSAACAYRFFSAALNQQAVQRLGLERELRQALDNSEFTVHYQAQVALATGQLSGAEALVRWQHPQRGLLAPGEFVAVMEETGLIGRLGDWVLHEALRQWAAWRAQGWVLPQIAVNVSGLQLQQPGLSAKVMAALKDTGADAQALCLELTETAIIDSNPQVTQTLRAIRQLGVRLALDDFGTGYSSLTYLRRFDIDELKIDRSFVADCHSDSSSFESSAAITAAIIAMAHRLGLRVVAEGVETQQQLDFIRTQGADSFQGYLFARPLPPDAFAARFATQLATAPTAALKVGPSPAPTPAVTVLSAPVLL
jgi:diguanylate cyclase